MKSVYQYFKEVFNTGQLFCSIKWYDILNWYRDRKWGSGSRGEECRNSTTEKHIRQIKIIINWPTKINLNKITTGFCMLYS